LSWGEAGKDTIAENAENGRGERREKQLKGGFCITYSGGEGMNEEMVQQLTATAERLAVAAESLDRVLGRMDAQQEALNTKVDRIVAAVEERPSYELAARGEGARHLQERMAELEKSNADLKAQAARMARKTLPPMVSAILAKSCGDAVDEKLDKGVLDKTLQGLSVEQRIAVKSELARAGIIE
jgi:predicted RNase H-like nuclease (RuvC/YqgF family)